MESDEICAITERSTLKNTKNQGVLLAYRKVSKYWILLDSESTVDNFKDKILLNNIRKMFGEGLRCYTNGGPQDSNMVDEILYKCAK